MKINRLNQWLTLAANIGVLAGIIFLAFELQQNTSIARSSAYSESMQNLNNWRALIVSDAELASIFSKYMQGSESFDAIEETRLGQLIAGNLGIYETAYFSYQRGIMGESEWLRFEARACGHSRRLKRININISYAITDEFGAYLAETCKE